MKNLFIVYFTALKFIVILSIYIKGRGAPVGYELEVDVDPLLLHLAQTLLQGKLSAGRDTDLFQLGDVLGEAQLYHVGECGLWRGRDGDTHRLTHLYTHKPSSYELHILVANLSQSCKC